jgi:hypothetical protein
MEHTQPKYNLGDSQEDGSNAVRGSKPHRLIWLKTRLRDLPAVAEILPSVTARAMHGSNMMSAKQTKQAQNHD